LSTKEEILSPMTPMPCVTKTRRAGSDIHRTIFGHNDPTGDPQGTVYKTLTRYKSLPQPPIRINDSFCMGSLRILAVFRSDLDPLDAPLFFSPLYRNDFFLTPPQLSPDLVYSPLCGPIFSPSPQNHPNIRPSPILNEPTRSLTAHFTTPPFFFFENTALV